MLPPSNISCCLITKEFTYPQVILEKIVPFGFGEIMILTHCPSPHLKQRLFEKAHHDFIYYQDDDCLAPVQELIAQCVPDKITCAMTGHHLKCYDGKRISLLGWGSIFPKSIIKVLDRYRAVHGEDSIFQRESERIMTCLSFPQLRLDLPITHLETAFAPDRLSMQPGHYDNIHIVEERCSKLIGD